MIHNHKLLYMKHLVNLKFFLILLSFAPVIFAATPSANTLDQKQTSILIANLIKKTPRKPYSARIESRAMYGNERSFIRPMFLLPLMQSPDKITFANLIAMGDTKKNLEGNIGFGARWLKETYIMGGFIHYDFRRTRNKKQVHQVTVGLEFFQEYLEYRVNIYVPLQERVFIENQTVAGGTYNSANISSTYTTSQTKIYEVTRKGLDLEVGGQLPQHTPFAAFVRLFYFHHDKFDKIYGVQLRASYQIREWLELRGSYTANNVKNQKNHYFAGVNFIWQFDRERHQEFLNQLSRKMVHMPIRDLDIDTREEQDFLGVIKTRTIPGRGILIPSGNVKADPSSNIVFNSIDEANKALKNANIKIDHIATTPDSDSGEILVTDKEGRAGGMLEVHMVNIKLGEISKDRLELEHPLAKTNSELITLGALAADDFPDQRSEIKKIRKKGITDDKLNKDFQKKRAEETKDLLAAIKAQEELIASDKITQDNEITNIESQKQTKQNATNTLEQQRAQAEVARTAAETIKDTANLDRNTANLDRAQAETDRQLYVNQKDNIKLLTDHENYIVTNNNTLQAMIGIASSNNTFKQFFESNVGTEGNLGVNGIPPLK